MRVELPVECAAAARPERGGTSLLPSAHHARWARKQPVYRRRTFGLQGIACLRGMPHNLVKQNIS